MDPCVALKKHLLRLKSEGVSQEDFAALVGLSQSAVSQIANKRRPAPLHAVPALNRELGTSFDDWARVAAAFKRARKVA